MYRQATSAVPHAWLFFVGLVISLAFVPVIVFGAYNDLTFDADTTLTLPSTGNSYTVSSGAEVEQMTVNSANFVFEMENSSSLTLQSSDKHTFTVAGDDNCTTTTACTTVSSVTLTCTGSSSVTITPSTSACAAAATTDDSSSTDANAGGSGGAGVSPTPSLPSSGVAQTNIVTAVGNPVPVSVGGSSHTVTVNSATDSQATVTIQSDPITVTLQKNETKNLDTDNDGYYDYRVGYLGLSSGKPRLLLVSLDNSIAVASGDTLNTCDLSINTAYKHNASPAVYFITPECTKRAFSRSNVFFTYFDAWSDVVVTSKTRLDAIPVDALGFLPWGPKFDPQYGALVKITSDPKVYLLLGTERYWITSESVFNALNYQWGWIEDVDPRVLNKYTVGSEINYTDRHPNFTLVKYENDAKVYRLEPDPTDASKQVRRHIKDEAAFTALRYRWDRIVTIGAGEQYADGPQLTASDIQ